MTEYRASFDASVTFANGGGLTAAGFRVDVPSPDVDEAGIAALFVASLGLLMTQSVELSNVEVFAEPHKGTRGGPSDRPAGLADPGRDAGRAQPRDPGRDGHLSRAARAGDHLASDPGSLTCPLRPGDRVHDRPDQPGRQHRDLPRRALSPLRRRRRPGRGRAGADRRPARRRGPGHRSTAAGHRRRRPGRARRAGRGRAAAHRRRRPVRHAGLRARTRTSSPRPGPRGWPGRTRPWSGSTRSTSTTPRTGGGPRIRCCSRPGFRWSST